MIITNHTIYLETGDCVKASSIEGVSIFGFKLGLALCKGWNFKVERTQMRVGMWAMYLGGEITCGLFNSVQCVYDYHFYSLDANDQLFFDTILSNTGHFSSYRSIIGAESIAKSISIIGISTQATLNSCSMEKFSVGCVAEKSNMVWNTAYVEDITETIAVLTEGNFTFNNMVGSQSYLPEYAYIATGLRSKIVLNNCHTGSFYPTYSYSHNPSNPDDMPVHTIDTYNHLYYNHKAYIINHNNKIDKPLRYVKLTDIQPIEDGGRIESSYIDYNVGDTLFIMQYFPEDFYPIINEEHPILTEEDILEAKQQAATANEELEINYGDYYKQCITLKAALERIKSDYNYRNVKYLVLQTNLILDESLEWKCDHPIIIQRNRLGKTITFNELQHISCCVTFRNVNLILNSSLCQAFGCAYQELRFEGCHFTVNGPDIYLVDNTADDLPTTDGFSKYISIFSSRAFPSQHYYINSWNSEYDATRFIVDVSGTYRGGGN